MSYGAAQLAHIRNSEQHTRWHLGVYQPPTVLACLVNDADIEKGERLITYDGVSAGAWGDVDQDMMMYVGSAAGKADYGRIRVESLTATVITAAENDDIEWANNLHLTVVRFWEPLAIYPRQTYDEAEDEVSWFKRYNVAYTDQNLYGNPVPCMGGHFAGFVDHPSGVFFDGSDSYVPLGQGLVSLTYSWVFPSGTPATSAAATPGYVQYGQAGHYTAELTIQTGEGNSYTSYRHIMLFDRPGEGPNRPWVDTEFDAEVLGSRETSGYEAQFRVHVGVDDLSLDAIRDGTLCIIFAEEWFGADKISYGQHQGREHIVFVGYIQGDTLTLTPGHQQLSFRASSALSVFGNRDLFPVALDYTTAHPTEWYRMYEMTVDKALYHYLMWHTTLYRVADTTVTGDDKLIQFATFGRQNILQSIQAFLNGTLFARACTDAQGFVYTELDPNVQAPGDRSLTTQMTLLGTDWRDELVMPRFWENTYSQLELGGVYFFGPKVEEDFDALLSVAPGHSPAYSGNPQTLTGFVVGGQTALNALSGRRLAQLNNPFANAQVLLSGNYRCLDIAPFARLEIDAKDLWDPRGSKWTQEQYLIQEIRHQLTRGRCLTSLVISAETDGPPGETIIIPDEPSWEPTEWPPIPAPVDPPYTSDATGLGTVYVMTDTHLGRTTNFDAPGGASWVDLTGALAGTLLYFILDPWDPRNGAYAYSYDGADKGGTGIWHCSNLSSAAPTWTLKYTITQMEVDLGQAVYAGYFRGHMAASINEDGYVGLSSQSTGRAGYWHTHDRWASVTYVEVHRPTSFTIGGNSFDIVPHHVGGNLWIYYTCEAGWGYCPQGDGRVEISKDGGHTFVVCAVGCIDNYSTQTYAQWGPISCPYEGNEDGQMFFLNTRPFEREDEGMVYKSVNEGATVTPHKPGVAGPALFGYYAVQSHTYDSNRVFLWDASNKLWTSDNGMLTWTYVGDGDDDFGFADDVSAAGGFPYNDELFYALAGGIYYSLRRGREWYDATGDWVSAIGAFGTGRVIVPMWLE